MPPQAATLPLKGQAERPCPMGLWFIIHLCLAFLLKLVICTFFKELYNHNYITILL